MKRFLITAGTVRAEAELNESKTARAIWEALPIESHVNTWGDEIYFEIPVEQEVEAGARAEVEVGEVAYWPPGSAFCIFFGRTPASRGAKPQAASPVNLLGRIVGDAKVFKAVRDGEKVVLSRESAEADTR